MFVLREYNDLLEYIMWPINLMIDQWPDRMSVNEIHNLPKSKIYTNIVYSDNIMNYDVLMCK